MRRLYIPAMACVPVGMALLLLVRPQPPAFDNVLRWPNTSSGYRSIRAGATQSYSLYMEAGQYARVVVDQRDIDLGLAVTGPGVELPAMNASEWGQEAVAIVAKAAGAYRVQVVAGTDDSARGRYRIALTELRQARPEDQTALQAHVAFSQAESVALEDSEAGRLKGGLLQQAIAGWHAAGDGFHEAQALNRAGRFYARLGRYTDAQQAFEAALALWNQLEDRFGRIETLKLLANLGGVFGQERAPLPVLLEYLETWRQLGDRRGEALLVSSIGTQFRRAGDYRRAIAYEARALSLREALGNRRAIADSLDALASRYVDLGQLDQAFSYAERTLRLRRAIGDRHGIAAGLYRLGAVLERAGRYEEMARYLEESLAIRQAEGDLPAQSQIHRNLSFIQLRRGNFEASLAQAKKAMEIEDRVSTAIAPPVLNWASRGWGAARATYVSALLALHWKQPNADYGVEAFLAADSARGRYIIESGPADLVALRQLLDRDTVLLEYRTFGAEGVVWILTRDGFRIVPLLYVQEIQSLARKAVNLLSVRGSPPQGRHEKDHSPATNLIDTDYASVAARLSQLLLAPAASELHASRVLVVSDETFAFLPFAPLPDPNRSDGAPLIVGHEIVHLVSATAAAASQERPRRPPGQFLAVVADPVFDARDQRVQGSVLTGQEPVDPDVVRATRSIGLTRDGAGIPRLPFARQEAQAIVALAPAQATLFLDFAASRERVIQSLDRYRVLHFTTHGIVNSEEPELSGLVFSLVDRQGRPREGFLRLRDIYALKVPADLVTLAACQTALGREADAHGVIGLTAAFLHAGAARVLSTAWKVDDEATAALMASFYRSLLKDHLSPSAALRHAQLSIAANDRWRSPYYWAGVFLYGDWRTMWTDN